MSGEGFCGVVRDFFYFGDGIAYGDGEANATQQRDIGKVVADECDGGIGYASFLNDFLVGRHFYRLFHVNKFHFHFMGTAQERGAFTTGDAAGAQASRVREGEALAIVRVEGFYFEGGAVVL